MLNDLIVKGKEDNFNKTIQNKLFINGLAMLTNIDDINKLIKNYDFNGLFNEIEVKHEPTPEELEWIEWAKENGKTYKFENDKLIIE